MKRKILDNCLQIAMQNNIKHPEWDHYHHFSFIIQNNAIVEWGTNRPSSPMILLGYPPYTKMHSEVDAYFKAKGLMQKGVGFEVVNVRLTKTYRIRASDPCKCCFGFLRNLGCKRVWFTTNMTTFASLVF